MGRASKYSVKVRERAVRLVFEQLPSHDSEWAAITSIAEKIGCTAEALRRWVRQTQRDAAVGRGSRPASVTV
jgi:transposase-like protein